MSRNGLFGGRSSVRNVDNIGMCRRSSEDEDTNQRELDNATSNDTNTEEQNLKSDYKGSKKGPKKTLHKRL